MDVFLYFHHFMGLPDLLFDFSVFSNVYCVMNSPESVTVS